jgi:hypothetical protein
LIESDRGATTLSRVGRLDAGGEHERDHERRIDHLAEAELLQHLERQTPDADRRQVATDTDVDPRPDRATEAKLDLVFAEEQLERLHRGEVAARMVADRDLLAGKLFRR